MTKFIKNADTVDHNYLGQIISVGSYYQIQSNEEIAWVNDSMLLTDIGSGDAVVAKSNSGSDDILDVNDGINYLKDNLPKEVYNIPPFFGRVSYELKDLKNAGSVDMNVDGSTNNVVFKFSPNAGQVWYLEKIMIFILDGGTMSFDKFGSLTSALTNGCAIKIKSNGIEYTTRNIKTNVDLLLAFPDQRMVGSSSTAFLDEDDYYAGSIIFKNPIKLADVDNDLVKIVIKDNLTGIDAMHAQILVWRTI